jgi:hypothetical protein
VPEEPKPQKIGFGAIVEPDHDDLDRHDDDPDAAR